MCYYSKPWVAWHMWSGIINSVSFNHSQNQAPGSIESPHTHQRGEHRGINPRHTKKGYLTICDSRVVDPVGKGVLPTLFYIQMRWLQWASHFFAIGSCCWREDEPTSRKNCLHAPRLFWEPSVVIRCWTLGQKLPSPDLCRDLYWRRS